MNNERNPLIFACLMEKPQKFGFIFPLCGRACDVFSVWNEVGRNRLDMAFQNLDNATNKAVTCKRHPFFIPIQLRVTRR